ncbi:MAG: MotA/TolQ/ExbB proton channel family protein [Eubacteriales bacterium]|nr:MotA/TolQ/ExbB proton channel family protein [Eubacteriales bacterium]
MPTELLSQLSSGLSEVLIYGAIAVVTLVGLLKCIYPVFRNGALLNRAIAKLERNAGSGEKPVWREARFLGRSLRGDWQRFLLNAGQLDLRGMPCDLQDYINEDSAVDKPGHSQLAELIPGLLTSLGILGTFVGLMEGLTSVDFSNAEGTIESIPMLLSGMRFAFATSVAGIACSLLFNMFYRMAVGRAYRALDSFDEAFYELAMPRPLSPEVQLICQKQDEEERMAHLAEAVGNRVAASLEIALGRAMAPLTQSLDSFIRGATQEQMEGIRRIVGQFVQQLNASLSGQMTSLGDTMALVNKEQLQTQQNLRNTLSAAQAMADDAHVMQQSSAEIAQLMKDWSDEVQRTQAQRFQSMADMEDRNQVLSMQIEKLTRSLSQMRQAVDRFSSELDGTPAEPSGDPGAPLEG